MTMSEGASLLMFLDAPVVVGDPDGRVIYVNPSFEERFGAAGNQVQGEALASLFAGGAREQMLAAVAGVCESGATQRFRLREGGAGYLALVSPIHSGGDQLGVIILLTDEPLADEKVLTFHREMTEPLDEATQCLEDLIEQTGGRRGEQHRVAVEKAMGALERARKWSDELHHLLSGRGARKTGQETLDPVRVVHQVAARVASELESRGVTLDVLAPAQLASIPGDASRLETALVHLVRQRVEAAEEGDLFALSCRDCGPAAGAASPILFAFVDPPRPGSEPDETPEPAIFRDTVEALGGEILVTNDHESGRVTLVALPSTPAT